MVTTMAFLQYYLKSSTKRGWEMSRLLVAIHIKAELRPVILRDIGIFKLVIRS